MNSDRKNAMPRRLPSSASASPMPSTISALTLTAANFSVVHRLRQTDGSVNAIWNEVHPDHFACDHGVPMLHS